MTDDDREIVKSDSQKELDLNFHTDLPVGEILRRTRVHYGQSLAQIENVLRIRASQLGALESGDIAQLPGRVYAIGFVRSYSEYLGLDGDKMVHLFKEQSVGRQKKPDLSFSVPAAESKVPGKAVLIASSAGILLLVIVIAFVVFPRTPKTSIPAVPEELSRSQLNQAPALIGEPGSVNAAGSAPAQTAVQGGSTQAGAMPGQNNAGSVATAPVAGQPGIQTSAATPPVSSNRIVLQIVDSSWIEIKNPSGGVLLRQVLKKGDVFLVPNEKGLVMATGNAGGVKIVIDGRELPRLGETGQIKRNIALDPAAFATIQN